MAGLTTILQEMLSGIRIVKSFVAEKIENMKYDMASNTFFKLVMRQEKLSFLNAPINEMIGVALGVTLLWIGGMDVLNSPDNMQQLCHTCNCNQYFLVLSDIAHMHLASKRLIIFLKFF